MSGRNTLRNYRIASLYGLMSYSQIARRLGCSKGAVAGYVRHHVLKVMRDHVREREGRNEDERIALPPTVAYVRGLEDFGNHKYRMETGR